MENKEMENANEYRTADLVEASSLVALRFALLNIDFQVEGSKIRGYFVFEDSDELQDAKMKSLSKKLSFEPREFQGIIRSLKGQLSNRMKSPQQQY